MRRTQTPHANGGHMSTRESNSVSNPAGTRTFTEWNQLADAVAAAFRLTPDEKRGFKSKKVAQLVAALPFLADARDPQRIAIRNLGAYLLSVRGSTEHYFDPTENDNEDIFNRINLFTDVPGGNDAIVEKARCLLVYHMIRDYTRDIREDADLGKYNPVANEDIDAETLSDEMLRRWQEVACPEMDEIMDAGTEDWWWCC